MGKSFGIVFKINIIYVIIYLIKNKYMLFTSKLEAIIL